MQRKIGLVGVLLGLAIGSAAVGSTFIAMDQKALVASADAVVRGQVRSVDSFWNDDHTLILTEATFEVDKVLVGSASGSVTVRTAGGTVDGYTVEAAGFPSFLVGERALLFLERDDQRPLGGARNPGYRITGYQLGHYRIFHDRQGREIAVPTAGAGLMLAKAGGRPPEAPRAWHLADLETEIRLLGAQLGRVGGAP